MGYYKIVFFVCADEVKTKCVCVCRCGFSELSVAEAVSAVEAAVFQLIRCVSAVSNLTRVLKMRMF